MAGSQPSASHGDCDPDSLWRVLSWPPGLSSHPAARLRTIDRWVNPLLANGRRPRRTVAVCPYPSPGLVTLLNIDVAQDLNLTDVITEATAQWPLPTLGDGGQTASLSSRSTLADGPRQSDATGSQATNQMLSGAGEPSPTVEPALRTGGPGAAEAAEILALVKAQAGPGPLAAFERLLRRYVVEGLDPATVYLRAQRMLLDYPDICSRLGAFFPGLEVLAESTQRLTGSNDLTPPTGDSFIGEMAAGPIEESIPSVQSSPQSKRSHKRSATARAQPPPSLSRAPRSRSSHDSPDLLECGKISPMRGLCSESIGSAQGDSLREPSDVMSNSSVSDSVTEPCAFLERLVSRAEFSLARIQQLEARNSASLRMPPSKRTRSHAHRPAPASPIEVTLPHVHWERLLRELDGPFRRATDGVLPSGKATSLLADMLDGSVQACQDASATLLKSMAVWRTEMALITEDITPSPINDAALPHPTEDSATPALAPRPSLAE